MTFGELFRWASPRQGIGKPRDGLSLVRGRDSRPSFTEKNLDFPVDNIFQNNLLERTFSDRCFKIFAYSKFQVFHFPGSSAALLIGQKRLTRDFPAFLRILNLHVRHNNCLNINILYMLYVINMYVSYVIMGANI